METRLVRIPRHLLHVGLDDLLRLGVSTTSRDALRALLADLPLVPDASSSAQLVGEPAVTLACLAVLARHVGQGLRDHNLGLAHDRARLHTERQKLVFLTGDELARALALRETRPSREAALFVSETTPSLSRLLEARHAAGLASFVSTTKPLEELADWLQVPIRRSPSATI